MATGINPTPIHTTTNTVTHDLDPMEGQAGAHALNAAAARMYPFPHEQKGSPSTSPTTSTWTHMPTTLPSSEIPSTSSVGVGSLPGSISEESVAKLPEERRTEGMPSHDWDPGRIRARGGSLGSGGVGILPGTPNESAVVLCPDERSQPMGKAKLMDKLKGEAKVISGKIGNNQQMVEEGRRMMKK